MKAAYPFTVNCFLACFLLQCSAVVVPLTEIEEVEMQGGCCYNYYKEHKCICVQKTYPSGEKGKYPTQCKMQAGGHGPGMWVKEGTHGVNCTGAPGTPAKQDTPAPYWTNAVQTMKLDTECKDNPFCQDFKSSAGSCYDHSDNPSSGHAVVCNVAKSACVGDVTGKAGESVRGSRYTWFPPGYAMPDRNGVRTCCHCNAGCDHSKENAKLECQTKVGYRDVTSPSCNRKDGVIDTKNAGHTDLADFTVGRKKCPMPKGVSASSGVVRKSPESATSTSAGTSTNVDATAMAVSIMSVINLLALQ